MRYGMAPLCLALGLALAPATAAALAAADGAPQDPTAGKIYWDGQDALQKADWARALERFVALERDLKAREPASADTAIYWQVYALSQAHRNGEAKGAAERLRREFPNSRWNGEAAALLARAEPGKLAQAVAGGQGHGDAPGTGDEDLADAAVEALMMLPAERALPLLKKVLAGNYPARTKQRALFVLAQMDSEAGLEVVAEAATSGSDDGLRREAIRMLGISGERKAEERLAAIYAGSPSVEDRRAVIQSWVAAERKDLLLKSARGEANAELRTEAIHALGALEATSELTELLKTTTDTSQQQAIVQSLGVAGDSRALEAIATQPGTLALRSAALQALGVADAGDAIVRVLQRPDLPAELREAALQGLLVAGDDDRLVDLYRKSRNNDEKRSILRLLSAMGSDKALDVIEGELK